MAGAPSALGKILAKALADVPSSFCTYYMDDVLVYSKDPWSHIKHLAVVLKAILHFGLKLRLDKCNFFRNQIEFLGHNITKDRYAIIKSYIEPITDWPLVASKYDAQSFLGSANYNAKFIPYFATKAKPLYDVLKRPGDDKAVIKFPKRKKGTLKLQ